MCSSAVVSAAMSIVGSEKCAASIVYAQKLMMMDRRMNIMMYVFFLDV